jgi:hypothetical protein
MIFPQTTIGNGLQKNAAKVDTSSMTRFLFLIILKTTAARKEKNMQTISPLTEMLSSGKAVNPDPVESKNLPKTIEQGLPSCEPLPPGVLPLKSDHQARQTLAARLYRDFHAMKTYGKEPESLESIISLFNETMEDFSGDEIFKAMHKHAKASPEFPTPADIITRIENARLAARMAERDKQIEEQRLIESQDPERVARLRRYKAKGISLTPLDEEILAKAACS